MAKKSTKKSRKKSAKKSTKKSAKKSAKKSPAKAAKKAAGRPARVAAKMPTKKTAKKSARKPAKKPAKKTAKKARAPAKGQQRSDRSAAPGPSLLGSNPSRRSALTPATPARAGVATAASPARGVSSPTIPGPAPAVRAAFEEAFATASIQVRAIGARLRRIVLETLAGAREEPFGGERVRGFRYYAAERHLNSVCSIQPGDDHCQLYFKDGSQFTDPLRLLLGSGDGIRHVRVTGLDSPSESALRDLISQGKKLAC